VILILGRSGQVARRLLETFGDQARAWGRNDLDLATCTRDELRAKLAGLASEQKLKLIINAAAYTAVDRAESDPETAMPSMLLPRR